MSSETGNKIKVNIFGESHGTAIGAVIDNLPSGEYIDFVSVQNGKETVMILVRGTDLHDYCDLVPIRNGDVLVYIQNFTEMIFGVVTDFSKIISENALMLLFAIGLPVCSLGVGLLIRLKERT